MKILGGKYKGRNFYRPAGIRPTQDVVRKAIFDILGQDLTGMDVLDLFAGSGAIGMEAVSRNAKKVVFVEHDSRCTEVIHNNFLTLSLSPYKNPSLRIEVVEGDAFAAIKKLSSEKQFFHIVFADPPYGKELAKKTLKTLLARDIVHPDSFIIIQHEKAETLPETPGRFIIVRDKRYGKTCLTIYQVIN